MRTTLPSVRPALGRARRLLAISALAGRLSLALSATLLLGSSLSALATGNTAPQFTNVSVDSPVVKEGETFTLSGAFSDPTPESSTSTCSGTTECTPTSRSRSGQRTFSASHVYTDNT